MRVKLDRFGRIVIPKEVREELGLEPDSTLLLEEAPGKILLRPETTGSHTRVKEGIVVFTGEAAGDLSQALRAHREGRLRRVASARKRS